MDSVARPSNRAFLVDLSTACTYNCIIFSLRASLPALHTVCKLFFHQNRTRMLTRPFEEILEFVTRATDPIITALEHNVIPWQEPWSCFGPPTNAISRQPYSGSNLWSLHALPYMSNLFLTEAQVRTAGGTIKPNEQGQETLVANATEDDLFPEVLFNVSQCCNIPEELRSQKIIELCPPVNACKAVVMDMPKKPALRKTGNDIYYSVAEDTIYLPEERAAASSEVYYRTLFHLLVHATGHPSRCNRSSVRQMAECGNDAYSYEELVADIGTGYLCSLCQITAALPKYADDQARVWYGKLRHDRLTLVRACYDAQTATNYLLKRSALVFFLHSVQQCM